MLRRNIQVVAPEVTDSPPPMRTPWFAAWRLPIEYLNALPCVLGVLLLIFTLVLWRREVGLEMGHGGRAPQWVLGGGLAVSILTPALVYLTVGLRRRERRRVRDHLAALESLNAISTAISGRLNSGTQALEQLVDSSRRLLGMARAGILLLNEKSQTIELLASAGDMPLGTPMSYRLADLPACSRCMSSGTLVFEGDVARVTDPQNADVLLLFKVTSMILIPMHAGHKCIGLMTFSSSEPRTFSDLDRRLATLLGSQAAVILANTRMYEKMRSALQSQSRLLEQRVALAAVNEAIYQNSTVDASLQRITQLVPAVLGGDVCVIALSTGKAGEYMLAAATPPFDAMVGDRIAGKNPLAERLFETGKPAVIRDARNDASLHPSWWKIPHAGSILAVPLFRSDRQPLGVLSVVRHTTGGFTGEQVQLSQIVSALAAVAIENARLLEQTRRDADTKAELLREVNHRVKNNLAGIVGLLTVNQPEMSPGARRWLERATERIRVMAGAHQLFTGDSGAVTLAAIVDQTLSSLSVTRPPSVRVQIELDGVSVKLHTEQAVSLAMALHEVCYNAMVHGLGSGGTLTIRARIGGVWPTEIRRAVEVDRPGKISGNGNGSSKDIVLAIDVIDDGSGCCPSSAQGETDCTSRAQHSESIEGTAAEKRVGAKGAHTGLGLGLVKGLVGRELRGKFSMVPRAGGGTVATIEFPVAAPALQSLATTAADGGGKEWAGL